MNLPEISVKRPVFIVMVVLAVITLGLIGYSRMPVELVPNVEFPTITITTLYRGASSEEIENLVSRPIEDSLATVEGIDKISSTSSEGLSRVTVSFKLGTDIKFSEIKVREKVQLVRPTMPRDIDEPIISRFSFSDIEVVDASIRGNYDLFRLRQIADDEVKTRLEKIPGVGSVDFWGGREKEVKITISKALLEAGGVGLNEIIKAIAAENINYPVGVMRRDEKNVTVRVKGKFESVKEIEDLPIRTYDGRVVRLKDIAGVSFDLKEETSKARTMGSNAIMFSVYKQSGANSIEVADAVISAMRDMKKYLPAGTELRVIYDTTIYIRRSVAGVQENILIGALLAIIVVWLFLGNFRSTMITAVALPDSLLGAFFLVWLAGYSVNVILLMALSLAIGLLIDDSIVVRENIFRHVEEGMDNKTAAIKGTNEVFMAVLATTMSIMAVFIPISFMTGIIGKMFSQFGFTIAFALLISLFDAFTTAPMLSAYWYKKEEEHKAGIGKFTAGLSKKWNEFYGRLNGFYKEILLWALGRKWTVIIISAALFAASFLIVPFLDKGFFNVGDEGMFSVNIEAYPGAPIGRLDGQLKEIEAFIMKQPAIESYFSRIGGGRSAADQNQGFILATMKPLSKRHISSKEQSQIVKDYIRKNYGRDIFVYEETHGADAVLSGSNSTSPITLQIKGDDLAVLEDLGRKAQKIAQEIPGAIDVNTSFKPAKPELVVRLDRVKAAKTGISTSDVGNALNAIIEGYKISDYRKEGKDYDITVRMDKADINTPDDLRGLILTTQSGHKVPLGAIASVSYSSAPVEILREDKTRLVKINANVAKGYALGGIISRMDKRLKTDIKWPDGYIYEFTGQNKQMKDMATQMVMVILLSVLFMYMILASLYNSFIQPLILMLSVPLAIIGAFTALLITGKPLDMMGFIGILMVIGLVAKNAILLIDFTNKKREQGMSVREALLHAGPIRLRPILMTTFAMIFGMLPIALGIGEGGRGMESMPVAVIGGLLTSTFLTLVVVPVVYELVEGRNKSKVKSKK
jgi:HAE1 family hydrophobic/amphiphilic exporter-1